MSPERPLAPKSYCATVGFFCLPSAPIFKKFLCQGKRSQLRKKVTSTEKSYCAAVGIFACVLLKLYKAPFPAGKKPGRSCCAAKPLEDAACSGILLRRGRKFLPVPWLTPYKPSFTIEKKPGSAFCVGMSPERPLAPKSYCAAVGIFACALLTPYKPSLTTEKKPGSAFCVAKPPKKPLAAESYRGAVGICWVGLACHSRCPILQAPPSWSKGPVASWMR